MYRIVEAYIEERGLIAPIQIDPYDEFLEHGALRAVRAMRPMTITNDAGDTMIVEIRDARMWRSPNEEETINDEYAVRPVFPRDVRFINGATYQVPLKVKFSVAFKGKVRLLERDIANVPVMVGSYRCSLRNYSDAQLIEKDENPLEEGGYFIISGQEKVLITQEQIALNRLFRSSKNGINMIEVRSRTEYGSAVFSMRRALKNDLVTVYTKDFSTSIPVLLVILALGGDPTKWLGHEALWASKQEYEDFAIGTQDEALDFIGRRMKSTQGATRAKRIEETTRYFSRILAVCVFVF